MRNRFLLPSLVLMCAPLWANAELASTPAVATVSAPATQASAPAACAPAIPKKTVHKPRVHKAKVLAGAQGKTNAATTKVEDVNGLTPFEQALRMLKQGRVAEARTLLRAQLQMTPAHMNARRLLAQLLMDEGFDKDAETVLQQGQDVSPQSLDVARSLALLQAKRGAVPQALETLEKSKPYVKDGDGAYLAFMAGLHQQVGQHEQANALLEQALTTAPGNGPWLYAQWVSRTALGDKLGARGSAESALASGQLTPAQSRALKAALRRDAAEKESADNS